MIPLSSYTAKNFPAGPAARGSHALQGLARQLAKSRNLRYADLEWLRRWHECAARLTEEAERVRSVLWLRLTAREG